MTDTDPRAATEPPAGGYPLQGCTVAASHGWHWIVQAFALFRKQPGLWILMALALGVGYMVIGLIPLLGSLANALLLPIFAGGLMLGCKALDRGDALRFEDLFAGFRQKAGDLVLVGAFNLVGWVFIAFAVIAVVGGGAAIGMMHGGIEGAGVSIASTLLATLLAASLSVPLAMATWFAPALIVLRDLSAGAALAASFFACLRNWLAFLLYGVVMLVLCVIAAIPLLLGYLVLVPVLIASIYTAYHDIYSAGREP